LDGDDVAAGGDQTRGVEVPEVVQPQPGGTGGGGGRPPAVADGVLMRRLASFSGEEPPAVPAEGGDVSGQDVDQPGRQAGLPQMMSTRLSEYAG
jgi:hypothetical protein